MDIVGLTMMNKGGIVKTIYDHLPLEGARTDESVLSRMPQFEIKFDFTKKWSMKG